MQVRINDFDGMGGGNLINSVPLHMVPKLDVVAVEEVQVHPVLLVLADNHKGGMMPYVPGLFVEGEGIEYLCRGEVFNHFSRAEAAK